MKSVNKQLEDIILELGVLKKIVDLSNSEQNKLNNQVFERWLAHAHREYAQKRTIK